jgi:hypothetical protein
VRRQGAKEAAARRRPEARAAKAATASATARVRAQGSCGLGETPRVLGGFYRGRGDTWACGPEAESGRGAVPDSASSPSLARGRG